MPLVTGQVLNNRYRIVRLLGQGGFGAVYRAWDLTLERPCAVKENLDTSPAAEKQFAREAKLLANLRHPHLPQVHDQFVVPGQGQYLVMDFVEGEDLQTMLTGLSAETKALPQDQTLAWVLQVCDALEYLHAQNPPVIHRDIKPRNIIITPQGKAMLVDFGIAKLYDPTLLTTAGARAISPGYAPVEQYGGRRTDARTDVYALGATLYACLTGIQPVESIDRFAGAALPPLRSLNPAVSGEVEAAVLKAMAVEPAGRYGSITDFAEALKIAGQKPVLSTPLQASIARVTSNNAPTVALPGGGSQVGSLPTQAIVIGGLLTLVILLAIGYFYFTKPANSQPTLDENTILTLVAAQTSETQSVLTALEIMVTQTAEAAQNVVTSTLALTQPLTSTLASLPCDSAIFMKDVTVPQGTVMVPNTPFTKTWRIRNDGSCTWDSGYSLTFQEGDPMTVQTTVPFPGVVMPGQTVDLSVNMTAPPNEGSYQSLWKIQAPDGQIFGVTVNDLPLDVVISVTSQVTPNPSFAYDLAADYCNAEWKTSSEVIGCRIPVSDGIGSVFWMANPTLERGVENEPGLMVWPEPKNGIIYGMYLPYQVKGGDHFVAEIGCAGGYPGCDVSFHLNYRNADGKWIEIGYWREAADGKTLEVDIDLISIAGQTVQFQLGLRNNGDINQAVGVWFLPSIRNSLPPPTPTPTSLFVQPTIPFVGTLPSP